MLTSFLRNKYFIWMVEAIFVLSIIVYGIPDFIYYHHHVEGNINGLDSSADVLALWGLSNGNIPYADFYWAYGPLYLYVLHFLFELFGSNYDAINISKWIIINILGISLSYLISVPLFKDYKERILFTLLGVLFMTSNMVSVRHLFSELTLSYTLYNVINRRGKTNFVIAGFLAGLSVVMGVEYGSALLIATLFLIAIPFGNNRLASQFVYYFLGGALVFLLLILYLEKNNTTYNFINNYIAIFRNFALTNPARGEFLPIPFGNISSFSVAAIFAFFKDSISIEFKFYLPLFLFLYAFSTYIFNLIKSRTISPANYICFIFAIYGSIIYIRTISGPAYGFMTYGFIPAIVIATFLISNLYSKLSSSIICKSELSTFKYLTISVAVILWIFFAQDYSRIKEIYRSTNKLDKQDTYNHAVGFKISSKLDNSLSEVNKYVSEITTPSDTVFVYPYGIAGFLSGRPQYTLYFPGWIAVFGDEFYYNLVTNDLVSSPPKLVILNKLSGEVGIGTNIPGWSKWVTGRLTNDSPVFIRDLDPIKKFIIENYELAFQNDTSAILKLSGHRPFKENVLRHSYKIINYRIDNKPHELGDIVNLSNRNNLIYIDAPIDNKYQEYAISFSLSLSNKLLLTLYRTRVRLGIKVGNDIEWVDAVIDDLYTLGRQKTLKFNTLIQPEGAQKIAQLIIEINTPYPHAGPSAISLEDITLRY